MDTPLFDGKLVHSRRVDLHALPFCPGRASSICRRSARLQARQPPRQHPARGWRPTCFSWWRAAAGALEYEGARPAPCAPGTARSSTASRPYQPPHRRRSVARCAGCTFTGRTWRPSTKSTRSAAASPASAPQTPAAYAASAGRHCTRWRGPTTYVRDMQICEKLMALLTLLMQESWHPDTARATGWQTAELAGDQGLSGHPLRREDHAGRPGRAVLHQQILFDPRVQGAVRPDRSRTILVQLRITQAKRLLRFSDKNVEAIAQECGLNDANYFSRLFKRVEGTTPGEYRRQW